MSEFKTFGETEQVIQIPKSFYLEFFQHIDTLEEAKVSLFVISYLLNFDSKFPYLLKTDLLEQLKYFISLQEIEAGLEAALKRGTFISTKVEIKGVSERIFFLNSLEGKQAVQAIQQGLWEIQPEPQPQVNLFIDRPSIYRLYEENIGPITPILADSLKEAEKNFSLDWIEEAFQIAIEKNIRNWRYISAILNRWQKEGKDVQTQKNRRRTEEGRRKYNEW